MALCQKQCADCPMTVTVLVEASDETKYHDILPVLWEQISNCPENQSQDIALILRDHGVDIASVCSHLQKNEQGDDCELF